MLESTRIETAIPTTTTQRVTDQRIVFENRAHARSASRACVPLRYYFISFKSASLSTDCQEDKHLVKSIKPVSRMRL